MLRILLADDHQMVRKTLRMLLETHVGWQVCGEASNGREAVELAAKLKPHIAVLDLEMPNLSGLEATRQIKMESPAVEVIICSMYESNQFVREAFGAGARGYVLKSEAGQHLMEAVEALSRGESFFTQRRWLSGEF
ncbi:MAG: response regulator transcription factor [Acidobacteriota bacterium]